jgi:hypothetical protein
MRGSEAIAVLAIVCAIGVLRRYLAALRFEIQRFTLTSIRAIEGGRRGPRLLTVSATMSPLRFDVGGRARLRLTDAGQWLTLNSQQKFAGVVSLSGGRCPEFWRGQGFVLPLLSLSVDSVMACTP